MKLMSEVKVVKRWPRTKSERPGIFPPMNEQARQKGAEIAVVAMGASTGGPVALKTILSGLSKNFPVPLLIAQHISSGFAHGFVEWLAGASQFSVEIASDEQSLSPGGPMSLPTDLTWR